MLQVRNIHKEPSFTPASNLLVFKITNILFCCLESIILSIVLSVCDSSSSENLILPLVLYGCEKWSLILWEERRRKVFKNRALRRIFVSKRDEVTEEWRKLHNEELNVPYCSPNTLRVIKSRLIRWAGHVACMGERRDVYVVLVGKPGGKRPLGSSRCRLEDNIKMDL